MSEFIVFAYPFAVFDRKQKVCVLTNRYNQKPI